MTEANDRTHRRSSDPADDRIPRLRLKPDSAKTGYVDGAWWPRSDNLMVELPALLATVTGRLGPIRRITYRLGEWASAPSDLVIEGLAIRLEGHRTGAVNTIQMLGTRDRRLDLLVIPPYTDDHRAVAAMDTASATGDVSTVDDLLMISPGERRDRTTRAEAVRRWSSED
ncbi:DUF5994 family protein [Nocardia mikamii]|uniref:DUF5994 family protein n=1 Tax=Nocardia mikamii TaxID=508464 RepID=UPI0007A49D54|nr:DUF5994 family protein [Nocardia mikamii]